jgi:DNA-binding transcriptional MerR regulator
LALAKKKRALPNKLYFKIGEASKIVGVEPYVLRYWEKEFPVIKPIKSKSKQRLYRRKDIETLLSIKKLLYEEGFTIAGAKQKLKDVLKGWRDGGEQLVLDTIASEGKPTKGAEVVSGAGQHKEALKKEDKEAKAPSVSEDTSTSKDVRRVSDETVRKLMQKIKMDLEWCLNELRAE